VLPVFPVRLFFPGLLVLTPPPADRPIPPRCRGAAGIRRSRIVVLKSSAAHASTTMVAAKMIVAVA
jgi:hypothetical protein